MNMKHKILFVVLFLVITVWSFPKEDAWGNVKKLYFYMSIDAKEEIPKQLDLIDMEGLKRSDREDIAGRLIKFGDYYYEKGNYRLSESFYRKVLHLSPGYWYLYSKLEKINSTEGGFFIRFKSIFGQLVMILKDFRASFMLTNQLVSMMFFTALLVFFIFSGFMMIKYFKLVGNDALVEHDRRIISKNVIILAALIFWPVLILSGWMIYPFLICGVFWMYLNDNEKKAVRIIISIITFVSILYSINLVLEQKAKTENFQKALRTYDGHLFGKEDYHSFDDKLKVTLAYSYYENGDSNSALDILNSTSESFNDKGKYLLYGNIHFREGDFSQSSDYYDKALRIDEQDPIALNNFTISLIRQNDPEILKSYLKRFPGLNAYRTKATNIQELKINSMDLWVRLLSDSRYNFSVGSLITNWAGKLLSLPILYYFLIFMGYVYSLKKVFHQLGESTYCSKCAKIIKDISIHRSYKMCDECHQLFSIKDVVFLETKILKEKELKNKLRKKYIRETLFSILIPGLNFNHRENNRLFLVSSFMFYLLLGFSIMGAVNFNHVYSTSPLFLNLVGLTGILFYLLINIFSVMGEEDGF